jgi:hypothetical protein
MVISIMKRSRAAAEISKGLFALDAVAVGEHQQVRKAELAVERRHAALGHRAQQQRVHLRPGAVDLVEEEIASSSPWPISGPGSTAGRPASLI